ncbi:hypothetical protein D9M71_409650 [compost metagenome]
MNFVAALELASGQGQLIIAKGHGFVFAARCAGYRSGLAAQYRLDASHQLIGVERLGQVIIGPEFQALDAAQLVALGGEHDDRDLVVCRAQPATGRKAVFARQHQVENHQMKDFTGQQSIHLLGIGHGSRTVALADEKTL